MLLNDNIFREYDIRGIYNQDFDVNFAEILGLSYIQILKEKLRTPGNGRTQFRVAVGRDVRLSGNDLAPRFKQALIKAGIDVFDLGVCPTPLTYFSLHHYDVDGSVSITGSHNPSEYNGFKLCVGKDSLHGSDIQKLKHISKKITLSEPATTTPGKLVEKSVISDYQAFIKSKFNLKRSLKVVIDAGNATAGSVAPKIFKDLGCKVIELFCELDGRFPNHHPDPSEEINLKTLKQTVLSNKADLGIAYDGDADRIGVIDETGRIIFGDELMILYSREILKRRPGATIIGEVKCSHRLYQDISKNGGKPLMWKTGHSLIKSKMKEEKAALAGEMSGHIFFEDKYFGYDDAIYASVRLLEILDKTNKSLSTLLADLPKTFHTPEIRVPCDDNIKFQAVDLVKKSLSHSFRIIDIDGVRIETNFGWGLLRASNTQPVIVMRFEANSDAELQKIRHIVEAAFEEAKKNLNTSYHEK